MTRDTINTWHYQHVTLSTRCTDSACVVGVQIALTLLVQDSVDPFSADSADPFSATNPTHLTWPPPWSCSSLNLTNPPPLPPYHQEHRCGRWAVQKIQRPGIRVISLAYNPVPDSRPAGKMKTKKVEWTWYIQKKKKVYFLCNKRIHFLKMMALTITKFNV